MVGPWRGSPTRVGHVAASWVAPQQEGAAKREHADKGRMQKREPQSWLWAGGGFYLLLTICDANDHTPVARSVPVL